MFIVRYKKTLDNNFNNEFYNLKAMEYLSWQTQLILMYLPEVAIQYQEVTR